MIVVHLDPRLQTPEGNSNTNQNSGSGTVSGGDKSTAGNTSAWVAAIRGLGTEVEGYDGDDGGEGGHVFLETTYRLPTPCYVCHQILRGETEGLRRGVM